MPNGAVLHREADDELSVCPECGGRVFLDETRGERICSVCGLVLSHNQILAIPDESRTDERHPFIEADDSLILPQLFFTNKDYSGHKVRSEVLWDLRRTAKTYNLKPPERSVVAMETRIRRLASQHGFTTDLANRAVFLFRKTKKMRLLKKPGLNEWALALLLTACRETGTVTTIEDLVGNNVTDREQKKEKKRMRYNVLRYHHIISKALKLKPVQPDIDAYVIYFGGKIRANPIVVHEALTVARAFVRPNSTPHCVAAAALYIATDKYGKVISQKMFCRETNISEISLRHWTTMLGLDKHERASRIPDISKSELD